MASSERRRTRRPDEEFVDLAIVDRIDCFLLLFYADVRDVNKFHFVIKLLCLWCLNGARHRAGDRKSGLKTKPRALFVISLFSITMIS